MHYIVLYPQNGDRIVTIDSVTSLHTMYILSSITYSDFDKTNKIMVVWGNVPTAANHTINVLINYKPLKGEQIK